MHCFLQFPKTLKKYHKHQQLIYLVFSLINAIRPDPVPISKIFTSWKLKLSIHSQSSIVSGLELIHFHLQ